MTRLIGFLLLVAFFGFGGALLILLALGLGILVIKLIPILLVFGLVSMVIRKLDGPEELYQRRDYW
ncbi:MAG: hypothetical protein IJJ25_11435 [Lachnospiraceae bacterium]|nr:hypothetical protein [Lachnospiraceae bacterium]